MYIVNQSTLSVFFDVSLITIHKDQRPLIQSKRTTEKKEYIYFSIQSQIKHEMWIKVIPLDIDFTHIDTV